MDKELRKHRFVEAFGIVVIVLALVRCAFPDISTQKSETAEVLDSIPDEATSVEVEPLETEPVES